MKSFRIFGMRLWLVAVIAGLWTIPLFGQEKISFKAKGEAVECIAFAPDGKTLVSVSCDIAKEFRNVKPFYVQAWDVKTGKEKRALRRRAFVFSVAFSPDGKTLAAGCFDFFSDPEQATIKLWDTKTFHEQRTLKGHSDAIKCLAFAPNGKILASGSTDKTIKLWDVRTGNELRTLKGHNTDVWSVKFSPDGKTLVSCAKATKLWDVKTGKEEWSHKFWSPQVGFSPDGKTLAVTDYDTIRLFDTKTRIEKRSFKGDHHRAIYSVSFSPDGKTLASAGVGYGGKVDPDQSYATIKLWDMKTGIETRTLSDYDLPNHYWVVFSSEGKVLVLSNHKKTITLWNLGEEK